MPSASLLPHSSPPSPTTSQKRFLLSSSSSRSSQLPHIFCHQETWSLFMLCLPQGHKFQRAPAHSECRSLFPAFSMISALCSCGVNSSLFKGLLQLKLAKSVVAPKKKKKIISLLKIPREDNHAGIERCSREGRSAWLQLETVLSPIPQLRHVLRMFQQIHQA